MGSSASTTARKPSAKFSNIAEFSEAEVNGKIVQGFGGFGIVKSMRHKNDGQLYAVKVVNLAVVVQQATNQEEAEMLRNSVYQEAELMQKLNHANIVKVFGSFNSQSADAGKNFNIVMELCTGGSLKEAIEHHVKNDNDYFEERLILKFCSQILCGLEFLHSKYHIYHRDIKSDNIFFVDSNQNTLKIGDFGVSKSFEHTKGTAHTSIGTITHMPPELFTDGKSSLFGDVWSFGVVLFELCALALPFPNVGMPTMMNIATSPIPSLPDRYSRILRETLRDEILVRDVAKRSSVAKLCQHDLFVFNVSRLNIPRKQSVLYVPEVLEEEEVDEEEISSDQDDDIVEESSAQTPISYKQQDVSRDLHIANLFSRDYFSKFKKKPPENVFETKKSIATIIQIQDELLVICTDGSVTALELLPTGKWEMSSQGLLTIDMEQKFDVTSAVYDKMTDSLFFIHCYTSRFQCGISRSQSLTETLVASQKSNKRQDLKSHRLIYENNSRSFCHLCIDETERLLFACDENHEFSPGDVTVWRIDDKRNALKLIASIGIRKAHALQPKHCSLLRLPEKDDCFILAVSARSYYKQAVLFYELKIDQTASPQLSARYLPKLKLAERDTFHPSSPLETFNPSDLLFDPSGNHLLVVDQLKCVKIFDIFYNEYATKVVKIEQAWQSPLSNAIDRPACFVNPHTDKPCIAVARYAKFVSLFGY